MQTLLLRNSSRALKSKANLFFLLKLHKHENMLENFRTNKPSLCLINFIIGYESIIKAQVICQNQQYRHLHNFHHLISSPPLNCIDQNDSKFQLTSQKLTSRNSSLHDRYLNVHVFIYCIYILLISIDQCIYMYQICFDFI